MNFSGSWKRAKGLVIAAWVLSLAFSSPLLHFYQIGMYNMVSDSGLCKYGGTEEEKIFEISAN